MKMMLFLWAFVLDVLSVQCARDLKRDLRILNGVVAPPLSTPYIVSLQLRTTGIHFCGGSLIREAWVLTAAHCNVGMSYMKIVAGKTNLNEFEVTEQTAYPRRLIPHPQYDRNTNDNDIMLIKLLNPLRRENGVSPITLPKVDSMLLEGQPCQVSGWGVTSLEQHGASPLLHTANVSVVSTAWCNSSLSHHQNITHNMICAGPSTEGEDACRGDSGGPLVCRSRLFGVVSWGESCGEEKFPGVYTKVAKYRHWIEQTISLSCSKPTVK